MNAIAMILLMLPTPEPRVIDVDLMEINQVKGGFCQVVFWDCRDDGTVLDRGYLVLTGGMKNCIPVYTGECYELHALRYGKYYIIRSRELMYRETDYDTEAFFRMKQGGIYRSLW